jgi:hypothetical protein
MNARAIAKHIPGASRLYHRLKPRPSYFDGGEALSQQARWTREQEKLWPRIKDMGWVEV